MGLNLVFERAFHLILMHLFCYIQCFEVSFSKIWFFSQKAVFSRFSIDPIYFSINRNFALKFMWAFAWFDWSNLFFDQSKIISQVFFKTVLCLFQIIFFKKFLNFSSLSNLARLHITFFVVFFLNFCKVLLPQSRYDYSNPPFCFIFMISCIFSCI